MTRSPLKHVVQQDRNLILANTYEYRFPSPAAPEDVSAQPLPPAAAAEGDGGVVKVDMTSRFIGLVVVPGQYITKIELAEFPKPAS
jgi:N-alpha-acetyltransferase 38, NatC auxiliary subunit